MKIFSKKFVVPKQKLHQNNLNKQETLIQSYDSRGETLEQIWAQFR